MLAFLSLLTLLCLVQDALSRDLHASRAEGGYAGLTNAERLARGLPVAKPKRLFGSKTDSARRSQISGGPGALIYGTIQFVDTGGNIYYVQNNGNGFWDPSQGATFVYSPPAVSGTPVEIGVVGSSDVLGFVDEWGPGDLETDNYEYGQLVNCETTTPAGSTPVNGEYSGGSYSPLETTVFFIDEATGDISATWINPNDQTAPDLQFGVDYNGNLLLTPGTPYNFQAVPVESVTFIQTA